MPRAVRATETLLTELGPEVEALTLVPSRGGAFEVEVDGTLIYSKLATGEHIAPEQLLELVRAQPTG